MRKILSMSLVATTGMTLFSYLLSVKKNEKFFEPLILNQLIYPEDKKEKANHFMGYLIHWLVGLFFSIFYKLIWKKTDIRTSSSNEVIMGFINGLVGVAGWHATLMVHKNPPSINLKKYYLQLIFAHIIFGWLNGKVYKNKNVCL